VKVGRGGGTVALARRGLSGDTRGLIPDAQVADFVTIGLLVLLEGLLSADNALVLAVLVLGLPRDQQQKALRYGMLGAFAFRSLATALAAYLIDVSWVKLLGAGYLLWLPYTHFVRAESAEERRQTKPARPWLGLTAFWATVVKVELTDIVFAIDSILVAVAMSNKLWVIITGGILGIVAMRMLIGQLLTVVQRYPPLVDGAFIIIAWVGIKLLLEYFHQQHYVDFEVPKWLSLGLIVVIFGAAYLYALRTGAVAEGAASHQHSGALVGEAEAAAEITEAKPESAAELRPPAQARGAGASGERR
jgi:YkoY family integral membrane protein